MQNSANAKRVNLTNKSPPTVSGMSYIPELMGKKGSGKGVGDPVNNEPTKKDAETVAAFMLATVLEIGSLHREQLVSDIEEELQGLCIHAVGDRSVIHPRAMRCFKKLSVGKVAFDKKSGCWRSITRTRDSQA